MNNNQSINSWEKVPVILNASQVALILCISESTVKRLARKGELSAFKAGEKIWRFEKRSLKNYIERNS